MLNEDGTSRGFGFVSFKEPEEAEKAVAELNGRGSVEGKVDLYNNDKALLNEILV